MSDFAWNFPYPSQRMPVLARNVVATSQPLAAQAGLQMLRDGGNAVDAALATAIAMTVLEPTSNGIGSDAFALIWINDDAQLYGLNASGCSPHGLAAADFSGHEAMPELGWGPVTVPGCVAAWADLSERFGRLPFAKLFEPAIEYASRGYPVAPQTAEAWSRTVTRYKDFAEFGRTFLPEGRAPDPGEIVRLPDHARTLQQIASSRGEAFYRGELARRIAAAAKADGGAMTYSDLAAHRSEWVEPISIDYGSYRLHEIPPNGQGLAALIALGILKHFPIADMQPDCPDVIHLQIEAMKLAFADAHRHVADPRCMEVSVEQLLEPAYLESRAKLIDLHVAQNFNHGSPKPGGTILLCAADAQGNMVSFIQSTYQGFGSGVVIPGTGIAMQNRGACFTLEAGHPNQVAGNKRPYHTIIPGFVTQRMRAASTDDQQRNGRGDAPQLLQQQKQEQVRPVMAFGVMGGFMQPQGHVQVMIRMADFGQNPQAVLDGPRWQVSKGMKVALEPGFDAAVYDELRKRGHDIEIAQQRSVTFGGGQAIYKLINGAYCGASDPRRDGQAVGY